MWSKNARYLDYNAGAPLHPQVSRKLQELLSDPEFFAANPSSRHRLGQKIQHLLYRAATRISKSFGDSSAPDQLLFTSSGTEANQTVIRSALARGMTVLIGAGEHSASHDLLASDFANEAALSVGRLLEIPLLPTGRSDLSRIHNLLDSVQSPNEKERNLSSVLLSLFWANNETGVLHDLEAIRATLDRLRREFPDTEFLLHLDGAQVWGKLPLDLASTPADWITFSSHKIGAPAGSGVIWSRRPLTERPLRPLIPGSQGQGLRGGTENWLGLFATGVAAEAAASREAIERFQSSTGAVRERFEKRLRESGVPVTIWGEDSPRVSNTSRFSLDAFRSYENWVELLDLRGFAVSHGSACKAQVIEPSRVLLGMGATREQALNSIRVSFGPDSAAEDADDLVAQLTALYQNKKKNP